MTPEEKAAAIAAAIGDKTLSFSATGPYGSINFAVSNCIAIGPTVWYTPVAWTGAGGNKRYLPIDPDVDAVSGRAYGVTNPPLQVPDGGTQVITDPHGNPHTVATFTRDDIAAAKAIVYNAVTAYAIAHGWTP